MRFALGLPSMLRDVHFGLRILRRHPAFACSAIAIMALGVGATTAVFSVLRGVLIAPLPYRDPARLVLFRASLPGITQTPELTSLEFAELRAQTELFESVSAAVRAEGNLTAVENMAPMNAAAVSEDFLGTLGATPVLGRSLRRSDVGAQRAVNISYDVWQRHFRASPDIIGRAIEVNGNAMTVVGVLPQGFKAYLGPGVLVPRQLELLYFRSSGYDDDPFRGNVVIARLRRGVEIETARAAVDAIATRLVAEHPDRYRTGPVRLSLAPLEDEVVSEAKPALLAGAGAVALVLLVACANLTNLLLVRASARAREIAVRVSIGARRRDIVRQLLVEGLVVGVIGAAGGWTLAQWSVDVLLALAPAALPRREAIAVDGGVAIFAMALSLVCALVVSLVPAWQATRQQIAGAVKDDLVRAGGKTRGVLVAAQLALSVVLLVGAGLMARAFVNMRAVALGFDPRQAASLYISLDGRRWDGGTIAEARAVRRAFYQRVTDQAREHPGVQLAGVGFPVPLTGIAMSQRVSLGQGTPERETDGFTALAGYLDALRVPLIAGRYFTRADDETPAVIVDERLASELWPGESAVGRRLLIVKSVDSPQWTEVVGVVAHVQSRSPREAGPPQVWMTHAVRSYAQLNLVVRASDPLDAAGRIASTVQQLGAGRPVRDIRRLDDYVADASADTRFALFVLGVLAALAVILAAVGVYGVVSYSMARRAREIAVRLALGASRQRLVVRVLRDGAIWTFVGLALGLAGAGVLVRYLESLLFHVGPHDAMTFAAVALLLTSVALTASAVPAVRASRVDPMTVLRAD
jgi:putative ABC transport system permease protein